MKILNNRGDTLVEVMLAAAVLSLVLAGAFTISNRATRINQNANERTQVSNLIQAQAESIRAIHKSSPGDLWSTLESNDPNTPDYVSINTGFCDITSDSNAQSDGAFYIDDTLTIQPITYDSGSGKMLDGTDDLFDVWVEATDGGNHVDFRIYACWEGIGGETIQNSGLVMRLNK